MPLIRQSDALMRSFYPAESNHLVDVNSLAQPNVHFFVARQDGRVAGWAHSCRAKTAGRR